jgi:V/A-type H+-transporting ATPase subunit C
MVRLSEDPKYGFAIGRVRALEPGLMDRSRYERFIRARSGEEFVAAVAETAYAKFFEGGTVAVTQAFDRAAQENAAFLSAYALDEWLVQFFWTPVKFRRIKTTFKSALSEASGEDKDKTDSPALSGFGAAEWSARVDQVLAEGKEAFARDRNPAAADVALDRLMQEIELQIASRSQFLSGYLGLHADIENLHTLVRLKVGGGEDKNSAGEMEAAFLPGGTLTLAGLLTALPQPWPAVTELLGKVPPYGVGNESFHDYLEQGRIAVAEKRSFTRMERLGRELELRYLRQTRYATFGHEPLVTFFLLRENELRNLRLLYAAKLAGRAVEETQDLVAYVE